MSTLSIPLYLQPLPILHDMRSAEADEAARWRCRAFHEAGHLFAAYRSDLHPETGSIVSEGPAFLAHTRAVTTWIAGKGFYVQGLLVDADQERMDYDIATHNPEVLYDDPDGIDLVDLRHCIAAMRLDRASCRRGGDLIATAHFDDEAWLARGLSAALMDWTNIEGLARELMTRGALDRADIDRLMRTQAL